MLHSWNENRPHDLFTNHFDTCGLCYQATRTVRHFFFLPAQSCLFYMSRHSHPVRLSPPTFLIRKTPTIDLNMRQASANIYSIGVEYSSLHPQQMSVISLLIYCLLLLTAMFNASCCERPELINGGALLITLYPRTKRP